MKLTQSTLERNFTITHKGKTYYINYLNSNGQILGLLNRNHWEIKDENDEELQIYQFQNSNKQQVKKNQQLFLKLIKFCIKNFESYRPNYKN